jgi:peptide/nickel transport system substrate-binding protein
LLIKVGAIVIAAAILLGIAGAGCAPPVVEEELELVAAVSDLGKETFDPSVCSDTDAALIVEPYMERFTRIDNNKAVGNVAERWETSADGLTWTFYLRSGIEFHNGDELTAADGKFSLERYMSDASLYGKDWSEIIDRVDTPDNRTVRIHTNGPQPYLLDQLFPARVCGGFIMPKDYIEQNGWDYFQDHPIGSGPFKVIDYVPGDSVTYEAMEDHWRIIPAFDKNSMIIVPEETTRVSLLRKGDVDIISVAVDTALDLAAEGYDTQGTETHFVGLQFYGTQMAEIAGMPIEDARVRRALRLAIPEDEIMEVFFRGKATPGVPIGVAPWIPGVDYEYWVDYAEEKYYYDLEEAKQLLDEAGYADGYH